MLGRCGPHGNFKARARSRIRTSMFCFFNGGNMRTTATLFIFSLLLTTTSWGADTFDMALPEEQHQGPTSGGFVDSFQKDLGGSSSSRSYGSSTSYQAPSAPAVEEEAPKGAYESAFTSYRSKKSSDEEAVDQADAWRAGQEKPDNFDVESLSYSAPAPASKSKQAAPKAQARVKVQPKQQRAVNNRAPASVDEIPMPEGMDSGAEIDRAIASVPESNEVIPSGVSAKDRKAMIMQTISNNYDDLKSCYHDGLRHKSDMKGKVVMGWSMDPQGRVSGAEVQTSQLNNKQVEKCMVERLSNWRFPRQAKLQGSKDRMTYTFQFVPERD